MSSRTMSDRLRMAPTPAAYVKGCTTAALRAALARCNTNPYPRYATMRAAIVRELTRREGAA